MSLSPEDREELWRSADADGSGVIDLTSLKPPLRKTLQRRVGRTSRRVAGRESKFSRTLSVAAPNPGCRTIDPGPRSAPTRRSVHLPRSQHAVRRCMLGPDQLQRQVENTPPGRASSRPSWPTQTIEPKISNNPEKTLVSQHGCARSGTGFLSEPWRSCIDTPGNRTGKGLEVLQAQRSG